VRLPKTFVPRFWHEVDGRIGTKKEILKRYRELVEDTGSDTYPQKLLCQRAAFMSIQLETMERDAADEDKKFEQGIYGQLVNTLSGLLARIVSLSKKKKKAVDLNRYLKERDDG
jgi:hypothetical protein